MSFVAVLIAAQVDDFIKADIVRRAYAVTTAIAVRNTSYTFRAAAFVDTFQAVFTGNEIAGQTALADMSCGINAHLSFAAAIRCTNRNTGVTGGTFFIVFAVTVA